MKEFTDIKKLAEVKRDYYDEIGSAGMQKINHKPKLAKPKRRKR